MLIKESSDIFKCNKERGNKMRKVMIMVLVTIAMVMILSCSPNNDTSLVLTGRIFLTDVKIPGYDYVTVSSYDYYIVDFHSDRTVDISSKATYQVYNQSATYTLTKEGKLTIITKVGIQKVYEYFTYADDVFSGSNKTVIEGSAISVYSEFTREEKVMEEKATKLINAISFPYDDYAIVNLCF
jgi:hypothetical protein